MKSTNEAMEIQYLGMTLAELEVMEIEFAERRGERYVPEPHVEIPAVQADPRSREPINDEDVPF